VFQITICLSIRTDIFSRSTWHKLGDRGNWLSFVIRHAQPKATYSPRILKLTTEHAHHARLDSKHELGYACSCAVSRWSHHKRSGCEEGANLVASKALVHLYKKMVAEIETSLVKLRDSNGAYQAGESLVHTNLQVLEMYVKSRKELSEEALLAIADFIPFEGALLDKTRNDRDSLNYDRSGGIERKQIPRI
jgi:hypothetical protein